MVLLSLLVALDFWYHWRYLCPHIIKRNTLTNWFYDKIMNLFSTAWMFDYSVHSWKRWDPISLGSEETLKNFQDAASSETFLIIMMGVGFPVSDDRQSIIDIGQGVFGHCVSLTFPSGPTITPHTHDEDCPWSKSRICNWDAVGDKVTLLSTRLIKHCILGSRAVTKSWFDAIWQNPRPNLPHRLEI